MLFARQEDGSVAQVLLHHPTVEGSRPPAVVVDLCLTDGQMLVLIRLRLARSKDGT